MSKNQAPVPVACDCRMCCGLAVGPHESDCATRKWHRDNGTEVVAQQIIDRGYYQTSRNHRMVARLPEGKTGREALIEADGNAEHWSRLSEAACGDQFLRCHAGPGLKLKLDPVTFDAFRRLGGQSYDAAHFMAPRDALNALWACIEDTPAATEPHIRLAYDTLRAFANGKRQ